MIDCISIKNARNFAQDLLVEQHKLRYREVVSKEKWGDIYIVDGMEFDQYDNLATEYYIARDNENNVVGVARSYPTTIPYMLSDIFTYLLSSDFPSSPRIFEASRLVLDRSKCPKEERRPIIDKLVLAYMERGLQRNIDAYIGFMLPKIWDSTFQRVGWEIKWAGPEFALPKTNETVRAAMMPVSEEMLQRIRDVTGIQRSVLNFGDEQQASELGVAIYSHTKTPIMEERAEAA